MSAARAAIAAIIIILVAAGAAYIAKQNQAAPATTTTVNATTQATTPAGGKGAHGRGPHAGGAGQGGKAGGMSNEQMNSTESPCLGPNGETPGQLIKWLLDNHNLFKYHLEVYPENLTIKWVITGPSKAEMENLVNHIHQMECIVENGGNPRPHDPLFIVDAQITNKYVHTEVKWINDTAIEVVKKADNQCAYEVIWLHAQIVKGFFMTGRGEASLTHPLPQQALEICKPYLNAANLTIPVAPPEKIEIINPTLTVDARTNTATLTLKVRNAGNTTVTIAEIDILGVARNASVFVHVEPDQTVTLEWTGIKGVTPGQTYTIEVYTMYLYNATATVTAAAG